MGSGTGGGWREREGKITMVVGVEVNGVYFSILIDLQNVNQFVI